MEKRKKKRSLKEKTLRIIITFALILAAVTSVAVCAQSFYKRMQMYTKNAYSYARSAAKVIDGDKIDYYLETKDRDDDYMDVQSYLRAVSEETALIEYYYVFVPLEDEVVYVWDGSDEVALGDNEPYMNEKSKADSNRNMSRDPVEKLSVEYNTPYGDIGSAYYPIYNKAGEPVALVGVDLSIKGIRRVIINYTLLIMITILLCTFVGQSIFFHMFTTGLIDPITKLTKSTQDMVDNLERDEAISLDIHTGDELETLAESIEKMDSDLRTYIKELSAVTTEREKLKAELSVAARIQESALPREFAAFNEKAEFDLYATMVPAREVGGDFYDFFMPDDDHIVLVMADVSGKGIPAALFMMSSKLNIKNAIAAGLSPSEALAKANEQLLESNDAEFFVTVWLAIVDINTGKGIAANAGHEHPILKRKDGDFELIKYPHSLAVATIEGIQFKQHEFELHPEDVLFVYTDGAPEATNSEEEMFGADRLVDSLNSHKDSDPEQLLHEVQADINEFVGDAPQFDDITMLAFRFNGKQ